MDSLFEPWPSIARLNRDITITEKIDGSNSAILVVQDDPELGDRLIGVTEANVTARVKGYFGDGTDALLFAQSRKRAITPDDDNFGFAGWVADHAEGILEHLSERGGAVGRHFGEWWGSGIQRRYGLDHKRFSLFNTARYSGVQSEFESKKRGRSVINTVPVLYEGPFGEEHITGALNRLEAMGSVAAPGFMDPEGIVVFHQAARQMFKVTIKDDEVPKSVAEAQAAKKAAIAAKRAERGA